MECKEILDWADKHDSEEAFWIEKEKVGDRLRVSKELTKSDLIEIIKWKFEGLEGRKKRILNLVADIDEQVLRRVSSLVFSLNTHQDIYRIRLLCIFNGIGGAIASTVLTFFDPENYGVFDIHVWREIFREETKDPDYSPRNYVRLVSKLREIAHRCGVEVRTAEKALYAKNYAKT